MTQFSASQIQEFTADLDRIAVALGSVRLSGKLGNGQQLTEEEKDEILISQIKLFRTSAKFLAQAIVVDTESLKDKLAELKEESVKIDRTLLRVTSVKKIIDFSELAIDLAAAVGTGDSIKIASSLNNLLSEISSLNS